MVIHSPTPSSIQGILQERRRQKGTCTLMELKDRFCVQKRLVQTMSSFTKNIAFEASGVRP